MSLEAGSIAQNIAKLRRKKRWTQRELAEQLHTDHSMVTRWEKGKVVPRSETLDRLAEVFEVSVEELISANPASEQLLRSLDDPELSALLAQISLLDQRDREALKAVLEAMVTRSRLRDMVASPVSGKAS